MTNPTLLSNNPLANIEDSDAFVFKFDNSEYHSILNSEEGKQLIDITKPQSPDLFWTLVFDDLFFLTPSEDIHKYRNHLEHRYNYHEHLRSQGVNISCRTVDKLNELTSFSSSYSELFSMMNHEIHEHLTKDTMKGSISVTHSGFAKICLNYAPPTPRIEKNDTTDVPHNNSKNEPPSETCITINVLNSELKFEPVYNIVVSDKMMNGKLYSDNELFKFLPISDKAIKRCYVHLLRFAQVELHKQSRTTSQLS